MWNANQLETDIKSLGAFSDIDHTDPGFQFRFSRYLARIKTSAEQQDVVHFTCDDGQQVGPQSMDPTDTQLTGSGSTGIIFTITYTWDLKAVVPK